MKKKKQVAVKKEIQVLNWYNKYDSSWKGILIPESFAHPAKISFSLSEAIYDFALEQGMIKSGDTVLDPFGGIAGTAFHAMLKGLRWVGVELEEKFVTLGNQNIDSWNKKYSKVIRNWGSATLVQGDSRKLRKVLQESGFAMVATSPPFVTVLNTRKGETIESAERFDASKGFHAGLRELASQDYGSTVGQLGAMKEGAFEIAIAQENGNGHDGNLKEGSLDSVVSSPPYVESLTAGGHLVWKNQGKMHAHKESKGKEEIYGTSDGQLGNLKEGSLDVAISSPPYSAARIGESSTQEQVGHNGNYGNGDGQLGQMREGEIEVVISSPPYVDNGNMRPNRKEDTIGDKKKINRVEYGDSDGQLGKMQEGDVSAVIASPPYADSVNAEKSGIDWDKANQNRADGHPRKSLKSPIKDFELRYGMGDGQLGAMKDAGFDLIVPPVHVHVQSTSEGVQDTELNVGLDTEVTAVVSSPPFAGNTGGHGTASENAIDSALFKRHLGSMVGVNDNPDNLGNQQGDTFWSASKLIVQEVHALLKDNGTAFWICKDFVRAKKIVPFCEQWMKLCESCGFETTHWIRAWQVKELGTQLALDGNHKTKKIERKSFFRRLHENKYPDTRIDYEVVIVMRKIPTEGKHWTEVTPMDLNQSIIEAAYHYMNIIDRIGRGEANLNYERTEAHDEFITLLQHAHITGIGFDWDGRGNARELAERIVTWIRE